MLKSLYNWILGWADRKHGPWALSLVSFTEASFFPIPPDPLLMALCLGNPRKAYRFALYCSVFSILGAVAGYLIGYWVWELVGNFFLSHIITAETFTIVSGKYSENAFEAILAAAFTPIPFKAFTVTAGVFKVDFPTFIAACAVGRTARFAIIACLLSVFGARVKLLIDKYFNILTVIFFILLLVGVLLLKKLS